MWRTFTCAVLDLSLTTECVTAFGWSSHPSTCSATAQCLVLNHPRVLSVCSRLWKNICTHISWECFRPCIHLCHTLMFLFLICLFLFLRMSLHLVDSTNFLSGLLLCFSHDRPRRSSWNSQLLIPVTGSRTSFNSCKHNTTGADSNTDTHGHKRERKILQPDCCSSGLYKFRSVPCFFKQIHLHQKSIKGQEDEFKFAVEV